LPLLSAFFTQLDERYPDLLVGLEGIGVERSSCKSLIQHFEVPFIVSALSNDSSNNAGYIELAAIKPTGEQSDEQSAIIQNIISSHGSGDSDKHPSDSAEFADPLATLKEWVERVDAGDLTAADCIKKLPLNIIEQLNRPYLVKAESKPICQALGVSPGGGGGRIALSVETAKEYEQFEHPFILVIPEVYGEEADMVRKAQGLVSIRGSSTSHAAIVATNSGVPCVMNETLKIDREKKQIVLDQHVLLEGQWLCLDGSSGELFDEKLEILDGVSSP